MNRLLDNGEKHTQISMPRERVKLTVSKTVHTLHLMTTGIRKFEYTFCEPFLQWEIIFTLVLLRSIKIKVPNIQEKFS
jgi:hypothetical protein